MALFKNSVVEGVVNAGSTRLLNGSRGWRASPRPVLETYRTSEAGRPEPRGEKRPVVGPGSPLAFCTQVESEIDDVQARPIRAKIPEGRKRSESSTIEYFGVGPKRIDQRGSVCRP